MLTGTVKYSHGSPIGGAWVSLYDPETKSVYYTITDSNEKYAIAAPADANYVFDVWYGSNRHHESPIDLSTGDITGHDVTMTSRHQADRSQHVKPS